MDGKQNIPYLDGWRGLAIIAVIFGHFTPGHQFGWVGEFGVELFFVLSGYLMCSMLFIKQTALPDFFARRLIRVFPTFLLYVAFALGYSVTVNPRPYVPSAQEIIATLTFLRTYLPSDISIWNDNWPIGHLWSLNVEEHSYVFLAALAVLTRRYSRPWLTAALLIAGMIGALIFSYAYFVAPPAGASPGHIRSEAACLGLLAGTTIRYLRHLTPRLSFVGMSWVPLAATFLALVCSSLYRYRNFNMTVAPLLLACAVNFLDCSPALIQKALSNQMLRWAGVCSFSLYLWQQPFFLLKKYYAANELLMFAAATTVGIVSFYAFENPMRKYLANRWESQRTKRIEDEALLLLDAPEVVG
jgi:peptidoglycan/LPS O-acetylase OafA/YrhL